MVPYAYKFKYWSDPINFPRKEKDVSHVVVPIHNNNHFDMLDVFLFSHERPNFQVTLYDYLDSGDKAKNLREKMWWAQYFGIYHQNENLAVGQTEYIDILDMIPTEFNANDNSVLSYSTLDHVVGENTDKRK